MLNLISLLTLVATGLATISNVVLVAMRYKKIKEMEMEIDLDSYKEKKMDAEKILKEITLKNNGVSPLNNEEKEQFEKLIDKINIQVEASEDDAM